jgi:hypothetical protein
MSGAGTGTARNFRKATPEELEHLAETHLSVFFENDTGEVYIAYSLRCEVEPCPLPRGPQMMMSSGSAPGNPVTFRICPTRPCGP